LNSPWAEQIEAIATQLGAAARRNEPLARYSAVGIGGPAELLVIAEESETLVRAITLAREVQLPWRIFGGLTNLLLPDAGLCGMVILNRVQQVQWDEAALRCAAGSGAVIAQVARQAVRRGWGGLTWAVGLPGTVGGAVVNNAGAFGGDIAGGLVSAQILGPEGVVETVAPEWFDFRYRCSRLKGAGREWVVLAATFQLRETDPTRVQLKAAEYSERRRRTQPPGRTLGSTFKNPPEEYAGRLIEAAGLKGARVGDVVVSTQHANFFMNEGAGTAADFLALLERVQSEVARQFGVELEPEIEILERKGLDA